MRHILVLDILASGATVVAQSSSGTAAVGPAGYIVTDLTTNKRVAARLERERDRLSL